MKKLKFLFFIPLLCAMQCEPNDPCGNRPPDNYVINDNLIAIENNSGIFQVGDTLWMNTVINKNQIDINSSKNLNLFNFDDKLYFEINLYKMSSYNQNLLIYLNQDHVVADKGEVQFNSFILVKEGDNYVNRVGIKLLESGSFKIQNSYINSYRQTYDCSIHTNIASKIINADTDNFYTIVVE